MKKQVKVYINAELWKKLKVKCAQDEITYSECIQKLIEEWIKEKKDEIK